jgi:uncharacterized protein YodC (DUF2158 family)
VATQKREATVDEQVIRAGDVVRLKSGGPPMTVEAVEGGAARVAWIDDKQQTHRETFATEALAREDGARPMKFR